MIRFPASFGPGAAFALFFAFCGAAPLALSDPAPSGAAPVSVLPAYPKNVAVPLLGARVRVNATAGVRRLDNFPVPLAASGMPDVTELLGSGFDGLEFSAGYHSLTILLPRPQVVEKLAFLDVTAEGTFTALLTGTDPQLLAQGPGQAQPSAAAPGTQTAFQGPFTVNAALFQPQTASFVQIEFRLSKPGRLARFAVYGPAADTDYHLDFPAGAAVPAGTKKADLDVAALWSGARTVLLSSGRPGADPAVITSDALGGAYLFPDADPAPAFDIDLQGFRRADRAVLLLSGPPSKVEILKIPRPAAPPSGSGSVTVTRVKGDVQSLNLDGTEMHPILAGYPLAPGKALQVGYDSVAELEVDGSSFVRVGPNSNVSLRSPRAGKGPGLSLLRGSLLWQVYGGDGGGELVTPALTASVAGGVVTAEVELGGQSRIGLLAGTAESAGGPGPVAISDPVTGAYFRPRAGEGATLAPLGGEGKTELASKAFSVGAWWRDSQLGAWAGGLHGGAEKGYFASPLPPSAGELLGSATTAGGLAPVQIAFPEQPLEAVRVRITPAASGGGPIAVVKTLVLGLYAPQEASLVYQPDPLARKPAPAPAAPAPVAVPPPAPAPAAAPPVPAPAPASPPAPVLPAPVPAPAAPPSDVLAPTPVPPPTPAPAADASPAVPRPATKESYTAESSSVLGSANSIYARQNSKGAPHQVRQ